MSETKNETSAVTEPSELEQLKQRADLMGIQYHPSIGLEKLREKVNAAIATTEPEEAKPTTGVTKQRSLKDKANRLVRVRVTCMNPNKREWQGEFFRVSNSVVGSICKYVPYNVDWHVPYFILQVMKSRQCQVLVPAKDRFGNNIKKGKLIREFAIEELPPLTEQELKELAQRQAMANGSAEAL